MKRNKGFTLIELLVVMAIIAILASIVVPNVQRYIVRARLTKAVAEINGINLSITAIVTDAGRGNLAQMFHKDAAQSMGMIEWIQAPDAIRSNIPSYELFENAASIYARVAYDLLRLGRDCLRGESKSILYPDPDPNYRPKNLYGDSIELIPRAILAKLGTNYMDVALDPWGEPYRIWPGPWRYSRQGAAASTRWPIPFRIFSVETGGSSFAVKTDSYMLSNADPLIQSVAVDAETWPSEVSYPADGNKSVFIWSLGQNNRNSQMLYQEIYSTDSFDWFNTDSGEDIAGGDDVNNWDTGTSWQRFYM